MFRKLPAFCAILAIGPATPAFSQALPDMDSLFARADLNHDGVVSRAEFQASRAARFEQLDRNHDGFLSLADIPQALRQLRPGTPRLTQWLARFDADHDGKVSLTEFIAGSMTLFDEADTNHDGVVDRTEAAAEVARIRAAMRR